MRKLFIPFMIPVIMTAVSCSMAGTSSGSPLEEYEDLKVSIFNADEKAGEIYSYAADVTSYYSHDRKAIDNEVQNEYRLSLKMIDGILYSRLDFSGDGFSDQRSRAIVSGPEEGVLIYTDTNEVLTRFPVSRAEEDPLAASMSGRLPVLGRIDMESIKSTASRLSFDVNDLTPGMLTLSYPEAYLPETASAGNYSEDVISCRLSFDTEAETVCSTEMVMCDTDGTVQTITAYPLYSESDSTEGEPVKVGMLTVVDNDIEGVLDTTDSAVQEYDTLEDIPVVSEKELERMESSGEISTEDTEVWLGDGSDPDYTETYVDLYEDIELNSLDDSLFKILL